MGFPDFLAATSILSRSAELTPKPVEGCSPARVAPFDGSTELAEVRLRVLG
jgi:hypothetical protein